MTNPLEICIANLTGKEVSSFPRIPSFCRSITAPIWHAQYFSVQSYLNYPSVWLKFPERDRCASLSVHYPLHKIIIMLTFQLWGQKYDSMWIYLCLCVAFCCSRELHWERSWIQSGTYRLHSRWWMDQLLDTPNVHHTTGTKVFQLFRNWCNERAKATFIIALVIA